MTTNQATIEAALKWEAKPKNEPASPVVSAALLCKTCGSTFAMSEEDLSLRKILPHYPLPDCCQKCNDVIDEERQRQRQAEDDMREAAAVARLRDVTIVGLDSATPARYQATDIKHPSFNLKLWKRVKAWRPTPEIPWIGFVGESGASKTRVAYLLLREIILESLPTSSAMKGARVPSFEVACAYEIAAAVRAQYSRTDTKEANRARDFLGRLSSASLLLVDDMGKCRNTPAVAEELFGIVDQRHAENLPMIWTSNSGPETIAAGMGEDMAGPFAGRLIECSTIITV